MKALACTQCGGNDFTEKDGYRICNYCGTKFAITAADTAVKQTTIAWNEDVERLLRKCEKEPWNARKYARLILEMDPNNQEVKKFL